MLRLWQFVWIGILATMVPRTALAASEVFPPPGTTVAVDDERTAYPVPVPSALAIRYHRTGQYVWAFARFWEVAVPLVLLFTGASARLRGLATRVGKVWFVTVGVYVVLFLMIVYLAELPLRYYSGFVRQHEYGLSRQTLGKWLGDSVKALGVEMLVGACLAWVPFLAIRRAPRFWWLLVSVLWVPFAVIATWITPVWIDPIYTDYRSLNDSAREQKIVELARRAGISRDRLFVARKSADTKAVNAFVTGLFGTKRIVLWDTLLRDFDEREVHAVLGHEMGHYALNHVARGIVTFSLILVAGLFWTDRAGCWLVKRQRHRFGFDSLADVAATPLIVGLLGVSAIVLTPPALAYSRYHEHEADRFALDLTHLNRSAARAFADLQRENLGVPRASLFEKLWRSSHPSIAERIEFCNTYRPPSTGPRSREVR